MRKHNGGVIDINGRWFTASDGTEDFEYREVVRKRGAWHLKTRGQRGTIKDLLTAPSRESL